RVPGERPRPSSFQGEACLRYGICIGVHMERPWTDLAAAILAASVLGLGVSPATAVQNFTDEAGQLLYTIDDNGLVSMFENSPGTDVTLSVTRGTREQMQPQVTEVIPEAVPAGSFTVLKLRGKNLVGVPSEGGGFCIEPDRTFSGSFRKAEQTCAQADRRLCRLSELRAACELAQAGRLPLKNIIGEWEWTSTFEILVDYSTFTEGA